MQQISQILALAATLSTASAGAIQGFNYGSTGVSNNALEQSDFETLFKTAKNLVGTENAFTSARLYTMIQADTTSDVISAIPAALATNTTLLLGLWASGDTFDNEITALKAAISTYSSQGLGDLVTAISVGSEDLYRISPTGIAAKEGVGADPSTLVSYISQVRDAISGTVLKDATIGHVDTWTAWVNGSNSAVIEAVDWLGFDGYPYWQTTVPNSIDQAVSLFQQSYGATVAAAKGKEVWVTETGWAVAGANEGEAIAGTSEAKTYWDEVGCGILFGSTNTYWFSLTETGASPDFSVTTSPTSTNPLYDLSCANVSKSTSSSTGTGGTTTVSGTASSTGVSGSGSSGSGAGSNSSVIGTNATLTGSSPSATSTTSTLPSTSNSGAVANAASFTGPVAAIAFVMLAL